MTGPPSLKLSSLYYNANPSCIGDKKDEDLNPWVKVFY
jgi:hypothetical protein